MKHRVFLIALFALLLPFIGFSQTQEVEKDRYAFLYRDDGTVYGVRLHHKLLKELSDQQRSVRTEYESYSVIGETGGRDYFAEYKSKYTNSSDLVRLFLTARDIKPTKYAELLKNRSKEDIMCRQQKPQWKGVELNETKRIPLPALTPEKQVYFGSLYPDHYSDGDPALTGTIDAFKYLMASLRPVDAVKPVLFKNANGLFSVFGDTQVGFHFAPEEDGKIHYLVYPPGNALFLRDYDSEVPPLMQSCGMDPDGYIWVADYDRNIAFFDTGKNMYFWHVAQASSNAVLIPRDNLSRSVFVFDETRKCFVESTFDPKQIVNDTVKGEVQAEQLSYLPDPKRRALPENTMKVLYCDEEQVVFLSGDALQARHRNAAKNRKVPVNVTPDEIVEEGLYDPETQTAFLLIRPITESEKTLYRKRIDKKITPAVHRYRPEFRKEFSQEQRHGVKDVTGPEVDPYEVRALWHLNRLETVDLSPVETLPDTSPEATETAFTPDKAGKIMEDLKYADVKPLLMDSSSMRFFRTNAISAERTRKNLSIETEEEYARKLYERFAAEYRKYPKKARTPGPNRILCSVPEKASIELETKRLYQRADRPSEPIRVQEGDRTRLIPAEWKDDVTEIPGKVRLTISPLRSSKYALTSTIRSAYERAGSSTRPSSWNYGSAVETPFDFSWNYSPGKQMSLYASCFNAAISISMQDQDLKRPLPLSELEPAFSFVTDLFHGYEKQPDVKQVDYFDLKPEAVKLAADQTGTVFKIDCPYREAYRNLKNEFYVLAVSDKGELSVEKAYYHFGGRDSVPENFPLRLLERDTVEGKTFFYHVADSGEATAYPTLADIPDTVFLTLPEGETSAEVTFYFISKDGSEYAAQKVELAVPEGAEPRTIASEPTIYDIQGEIHGTVGKALDKVRMDVEFIDASDPERGATDRETATFDSAFRLVQFGYPETQLKLTFSRDGYVSSNLLVTPEELHAEQERSRSRSRAAELFDRDTAPADRDIVLKKKFSRTLVNLPADMIHISGELKYDPANNTRIVCDLSEVEQGKVQLKTTDLETPPGSRWLEVRLEFNELGPDPTLYPPRLLPVFIPSRSIVSYRSGDEEDGLTWMSTRGDPAYTFGNFSDYGRIAKEDTYSDYDGGPRKKSYQENEFKIPVYPQKPYHQELMDRAAGKIPKDEPGTRTAGIEFEHEKKEEFRFLKCGKHYGKFAVGHPRLVFNPADPKLTEVTIDINLYINKAEHDRNLTVR